MPPIQTHEYKYTENRVHRHTKYKCTYIMSTSTQNTKYKYIEDIVHGRRSTDTQKTEYMHIRQSTFAQKIKYRARSTHVMKSQL